MIALSQEDGANEKRLSFGVRLGGGIGLSTVDKEYKEWFEEPREEHWYTDEGIYRGYSYGVKKWKDFTGSFDIAPFLSLRLTNIFAVQTEVLFTRYCNDGYEAFGNSYYVDINQFEENYYEYEYSDKRSRPALIFPVLAKLTLNPKSISIQTFLGPHFTVNYGYAIVKQNFDIHKYFRNDDISYPLIGLTAGGRLGMKTEKGIKFLDLRYFTDLFTEKFENRDRYVRARRARLSLTAGYEFCRK
jgi:hypothetical protein